VVWVWMDGWVDGWVDWKWIGWDGMVWYGNLTELDGWKYNYRQGKIRIGFGCSWDFVSSFGPGLLINYRSKLLLPSRLLRSVMGEVDVLVSFFLFIGMFFELVGIG